MYTYQRPWLPDYQLKILDYEGRATVTEGTTKAGKTVSHIIWLFEQALKGKNGSNYWWVAPVYSQAEIAYRRLKRFIGNQIPIETNATNLEIKLPNGASIWFKTGEKPDNLYGEDVFAAVMDEFTRQREEAWYAIRSTLTHTKGQIKFIGNVKGVANWGYRLARDVEAGKIEDWGYFKVTADDAVKAGILDQKEIDEAAAVLPKGVFLELYYGIPNETGADKFCYSFDKDKHIGSTEFNPMYPLYLSFDFNYNPICCGVYQHYDNTIFGIEVIKLENSNIYKLCEVIKTKYPDVMYQVTGDLSGKSHSALQKDNLNYYQIIEGELNIRIPAHYVMGANPPLEQNQVLVNGILEHYNVRLDPDKCAPLIFDCQFVRIDNNNKIIKTDRNDPSQQADSLDTFRYYLNKFHSDFVKIPMID